VALAYVLTIASLDELVHQSHSVLRSGQPADVLLDLAGGATGLLTVEAIRHLRRRRSPR